MIAKSKAIHAIGRRKASVARVYLSPGDGKIVVNGRPFTEYFGRETSQMVLRQPVVLLNLSESYDILVNVNGGGLSGQAGAARLAIARALIEADAAHRAPLKKDGLLSRDAREVERKKYGRHGARRRPQFSKR